MSSGSRLARRLFIKKSGLGMLGAGLASGRGPEPAGKIRQETPPTPARIREYRTLGRTGFKVSDLSSGFIMDEGVIRASYEAGMNYFDTAEQYPGHQRALGRALKGLDRRSFFISTKLEVEEDKSREGFLKRARKCLDELQVDYVDCLMMHCPEKAETLRTEGFHAAMTELKAEGRIKHVGVSQHGSFWFRDPEESMEKILLAAAADGRFDVFLMAYNFLRRDNAEHVLDVCRDKSIGVALMKTTPIGIYYTLKSRIEALEKDDKEVNPLYAEGLDRYREKFEAAQTFIREHDLKKPEDIRDAAIRFVLGHPGVGTVCCQTQTYNDLKAVVRLSGTRLTAAETQKLSSYEKGCGELYCRHACGVCEPSCPYGVPVNTILRYQHYFTAQGREKDAMNFYASIPGARADACRACPGTCETACPYGVPAQGMLLVAHDTLTMSSAD